MIDNQKRFDFIKDIKIIEGDTQDAVKEQIELFSQFLSYSNPDYAYNETYLPKCYRKYRKFVSTQQRNVQCLLILIISGINILIHGKM